MARHILVKHKDQAESLREQLLDGQAFDEIAKKYSICASSKRGGDLGEIRRGDLVKAVEQVIFNKALKKLHGPIKSKFGFHLIEVYYRD